MSLQVITPYSISKAVGTAILVVSFWFECVPGLLLDLLHVLSTFVGVHTCTWQDFCFQFLFRASVKGSLLTSTAQLTSSTGKMRWSLLLTSMLYVVRRWVLYERIIKGSRTLPWTGQPLPYSGVGTTGAPGAGAPVKTSAATIENVQWKAWGRG